MSNPPVEHLLRYLEEQAEAIERWTPIVSRNPTGEPLHRLRVATRRSRTALWILRHSTRGIDLSKLDHKLKMLGKKLGKARELDVAIYDAKKYESNSSKLKSRRKWVREAIPTYLKTKRCRKISKEISSTIGNFHGVDIHLRNATQILNNRLSLWLARDLKRDSRFHELRVQLKKIRYTLEALGKPVDSLRELQRILGRIHDLEVLHDWIGNDVNLLRDQQVMRQKARRIETSTLRSALRELNAIV